MDHLHENNPFPVIIRPTAILLYFKLLTLELAFFVLYLVALIFLMMFFRSFEGYEGLARYVFLYAVLGLIKTIILFLTIMVWIHNYYELHPGIVIHKSGIFKRHTVSFRLSNISVQAIDQSVIGRLFHHGTIELQNQFLREHFFLRDIPKPQKYIRMIKECMIEEPVYGKPVSLNGA